MDLVQKDPAKQPTTSTGLRLWRVRMGRCSCGAHVALGEDYSDGSSTEFTVPCPLCGDPSRGRKP